MTTAWVVAFGALSIVVIAQAVVLIGFLRRATAALEAAESRLAGTRHRIGGVSPGTKVEPFEVRNNTGEVVRLEDLTRSPTLFLFVSSQCPPCVPLLSELRDSNWTESDVRLVALLGESLEDRALDFPTGVMVLYQADRGAADAFGSLATPQAFAVNEEGVVIDSVIPQSINDLQLLAQRLKGGDERTRSQSVETARA